MTTTDTARFRVTTQAPTYAGGRYSDCGTRTHTITTADLDAGKYKLETPAGAASRIARNRHLDDLAAAGHTVEVTEVAVEEVPR